MAATRILCTFGEFVLYVLRNQYYMAAMCYTNVDGMGSLRPVREKLLDKIGVQVHMLHCHKYSC